MCLAKAVCENETGFPKCVSRLLAAFLDPESFMIRKLEQVTPYDYSPDDGPLPLPRPGESRVDFLVDMMLNKGKFFFFV